jgi:hypothetical protein
LKLDFIFSSSSQDQLLSHEEGGLGTKTLPIPPQTQLWNQIILIQKSPVALPMTSPLLDSPLPELSQKSLSPLSHPPPNVCHQKSISVVDSLRRIRASKGVRNVFKTLDFDTVDIQRVKFLPPTFNGNVLFELPPVDTSGPFHMMHGMDKRHDGHAWTQTITFNIKSDMSLT